MLLIINYKIKLNESNMENNPKFTKIVASIIEFNEEIGEVQGTPKRISVIISYLIIYKRMTQKQLKKLTGYSLSNISTLLQALVSSRIIKKTLISGTHRFEYHLANNIIGTNRKLIEMTQMILGRAQIFLMKTLEHLKKSNFSHLSGYNILLDQTEFMINDFKAYSALLATLLQNFEGYVKIKLEQDATYKLSKVFGSYQNILFEKEIQIFEEKIISFLRDTLFHSSKGPSKSLILPYFFTRGILTQSQIKSLTNLSAGAISQGLKELEEGKLIEVSPLERNKKGKKIIRKYRVKSISLAFVYRLYKMYSIIIDWKMRFQEINTDLIEQATFAEDIPVYSNIKLYIEELLQLTPLYENFNNALSKLI